MQDSDIARGDLLFLWHPGTEFNFSGYGLAAEEGRKDLIVGLLMIDRPFPASEVWLVSVGQEFGEVALYAMTVSHERGMACQMRIDTESLAYVRKLDLPMTQPMRRALEPLLAEPPKPRFVMHWDPALDLWASQFDRGDQTKSERAPRGPLFRTGEIVATPGALAALLASGQSPFEFLERHTRGIWGDLVDEDKHANEHALQYGGRLFSAYNLQDGTRIWVITEWNRSVTTVLLPSEY